MAGMDGFELTRRLKTGPNFCDLVIVALMAYAMKGDEEKACWRRAPSRPD
jgi:two-component system cell cycle response regulator DivK